MWREGGKEGEKEGEIPEDDGKKAQKHVQEITDEYIHKVDEVLKLANSTDYGLTASIWTNDLKTALNSARRVRSGFVWINQVSAHYIGVPFGGYANSGTGREEGLSELLSYVEHKSVNVMLR